MNKKYIFLLSFLFSLVVFGQSKQKSIRQRLNNEEQQRFDYYFFEAQKMKDMGKVDEEYDALRMCLKIDSLNPAVNNEISFFYARVGMYEKADKSLQIAVREAPNNWWYRVQYVNFLIASHNYEKAILEAEKTKKIFNQKEEIYKILASLYAKTERYKKAIKVLNQLEVYTGVNEKLSMDKAQYYFQLKKEKKGIKEIEKLIEKYPDNPIYPTFLGRIYVDLGEKEKGLETYQNILNKNPNNPYVYSALFDFYTSNNQDKKAKDLILLALENKKLPVQTKMELLSKYPVKDIANLEKAEKVLKKLIEQYPLEKLPHLYYAELLENEKRNDEALSELKTLLHIDTQNESVWKKAVQLILEKDDSQELLDFTALAMKEMPKVPEFYFYHSVALFEKGKLREALETDKKALENIGDDAPSFIRSGFYGQIADIYYELNEPKKAYENYEKALKENPLNTLVMNNYAYYLSLNKKELTKAEMLSAKTVELEPTNSTYLDTYAWILYEKKSYLLAKFYIEKAIENVKQKEEAVVLYDHAGDINLAMGDIKKAVEMWKKAFGLDKKNKTLKKKIEQYEK